MGRRRMLALLSATLLAKAAQAQAVWPERPVRLVVPVAAGGSQNIVARLLARGLTEALGQNVLVENQPGAGSNIGYEQVARARPDGYTLLAGSDSLSINRALFPRLRFDPVADFAPVARAVRVPQILVARADSPARTLAEFVALGRRGAVAVGTPGNGSLAHLLGEVVQAAAELRWTHVPYRGGAVAVNDLLGGSLQGVLINRRGDGARPGRPAAWPVRLRRRPHFGAARGADAGRGGHPRSRGGRLARHHGAGRHRPGHHSPGQRRGHAGAGPAGGGGARGGARAGAGGGIAGRAGRADLGRCRPLGGGDPPGGHPTGLRGAGWRHGGPAGRPALCPCALPPGAPGRD